MTLMQPDSAKNDFLKGQTVSPLAYTQKNPLHLHGGRRPHKVLDNVESRLLKGVVQIDVNIVLDRNKKIGKENR